jgi:hypothetical protein
MALSRRRFVESYLRSKLRHTSRLVCALAAAFVVIHLIATASAAEEPGRPHRILFLGNSITRHPPLPAIEWPFDHGMAASAPEKDYAHLLLARFAAASDGHPPEAMIENIADFERRFEQIDAAKTYKKFADFQPDLVILAIGENVRPLGSEADQARFKKAVIELLTFLQTSSHPRILVRSSFWPNKEHDAMLRQACAAVGGTFVDLGAMGNDPTNSAASEQKAPYIKHPGVGGHPGDKGMAAIAEAIWKALQPNTSLNR